MIQDQDKPMIQSSKHQTSATITGYSLELRLLLIPPSLTPVKSHRVPVVKVLRLLPAVILRHPDAQRQYRVL